MKIISSGVSVFEVELDLKHWEGLLSNQVPGFIDNLIKFMPSTASHKCMSGQEGGFHEELTKGTNFSHTVEHVLLELIHLSDPSEKEYSGWTKSLGKGQYVIHYGAPDFLTGRLAAILAVEIVEKLQHGDIPELENYLKQMRNPMEYFIREGSNDHADGRFPVFALAEGMAHKDVTICDEPVPTMSSWQQKSLIDTLELVSSSFDEIIEQWESAFFAFGGDFARGIADKVELINPDKFRPCFAQGNFSEIFNGVTNLCQMLRSLNIPLNFVTYSAWLFKNFLQQAILDCYSQNSEEQAEATENLDDFYQNIFHAVVLGYSRTETNGSLKNEISVCGFRARRVHRNTVLVVDDDIMARKVARNIIEFHGIQTLGARDGTDALKQLTNNNNGIGVVLLDLVMPGMSGQAVCRRIRDSHPNVRVILCSGFPLDEITNQCLEDHEVGFLGKPYQGTQLINMVCDLMDILVTGNGKHDHEYK